MPKKLIKRPTVQQEYDFSKGERGKYAEQYAKGSNLVMLDPDVAKFFSDPKEINETLRAIAKVIKQHEKVQFHN